MKKQTLGKVEIRGTVKFRAFLVDWSKKNFLFTLPWVITVTATVDTEWVKVYDKNGVFIEVRVTSVEDASS